MPELAPCRDECQSVEMDEGSEENDSEKNDTEVTDTSLCWPRNRKLATDADVADANSLFPFEKLSQ